MWGGGQAGRPKGQAFERAAQASPLEPVAILGSVQPAAGPPRGGTSGVAHAGFVVVKVAQPLMNFPIREERPGVPS